MAPKQGAKASTKAGRKPFATVPDQYLSKSDVKLSYFTNLANETTDPLEDDAWTELAIDNRSKVSVEFDGRVIIKQGDNKAVCTLTLHQHEYHFWGIKSVPKERETLDPITVRTTQSPIAVCEYSSYRKTYPLRHVLFAILSG